MSKLIQKWNKHLTSQMMIYEQGHGKLDNSGSNIILFHCAVHVCLRLPLCIGFMKFINYRCRSGTPIAQAVLVANDNTTNTLCSRSVTESNWNIRQQVAVAAKLDFKYDGTQVRSMFVWFRMVVNGTTIEKRCLQNFTVRYHASIDTFEYPSIGRASQLLSNWSILLIASRFYYL